MTPDSMTQTLYDNLEVDPDAPAAAVKAAHRRLSKLYHPDVAGTGDVARFQAVDTAYKVLRDPERRERYDRDGTFDGDAVQSERQKIASNLAGVFNQLLNSGEAFDERVSIIGRMIAIIDQSLLDMAAESVKAEDELAKLVALKATISRKGEGVNLFAKVCDDRIRPNEAAIAHLIESQEIGAKILEELACYDSFARVVAAQGLFSTSTTATSFFHMKGAAR